MPKLTFVIGAVATGKTYFLERHFTQDTVRKFNVYDYQQRVYDEEGYRDKIPGGEHFRCLMRANTLLLEDVLEELKKGRDVAVEHTLYKAKRRIAYLDEIRKLPDVTVEVYVMQPGDARWEANLKERDSGISESFRMERDALEFPNVAEGFDRIYEVVDGEIRERMDPPKPEILGPAREELRAESERIKAEEEESARRKSLLESMETRKFWHYCEGCGKKELLTAQEAYDAGWDYPPKMGAFGVLSPRTCGSCGIDKTLWWKIHQEQKIPLVIESTLSPEELITWRRVKGEPESLLQEEE